MKKNLSLLMALGALILTAMLPGSLQACDGGGLTLTNISSLPGGQYQLTLTFGCGAGRSATAVGANQNTGTFGFVVRGATLVSFPATLTSPATNAVFTGEKEPGDSLLVYDNGSEWWACIDNNCGPVRTVSKDIILVTQGLPTTIVCLGMEGGGSAEAGCEGPSVTVYPRCFGMNVTVSPDQTVYPGSPSLSCVDLTAAHTGGSGAVSYIWSTGAITPTINVCPTVTNTYMVTVADSVGCSYVKSVVVNAIPCSRLVANAGADRSVFPAYSPRACTNLTATATGGSGNYGYRWSTGATTATLNVCPTAATTYTVTITDNVRGCTATDQVVVTPRNISCGTNKVNICFGNRTRCVQISTVPSYLTSGATLGACGTPQ